MALLLFKKFQSPPRIIRKLYCIINLLFLCSYCFYNESSISTSLYQKSLSYCLFTYISLSLHLPHHNIPCQSIIKIISAFLDVVYDETNTLLQQESLLCYLLLFLSLYLLQNSVSYFLVLSSLFLPFYIIIAISDETVSYHCIMRNPSLYC